MRGAMGPMRKTHAEKQIATKAADTGIGRLLSSKREELA